MRVSHTDTKAASTEIFILHVETPKISCGGKPCSWWRDYYGAQSIFVPACAYSETEELMPF